MVFAPQAKQLLLHFLLSYSLVSSKLLVGHKSNLQGNQRRFLVEQLYEYRGNWVFPLVRLFMTRRCATLRGCCLSSLLPRTRSRWLVGISHLQPFLFGRSADSACRSCADKLTSALLKDIESISSLVRSR